MAKYFCIHGIVAGFTNKVDGVFEAGGVWDENVLGMLTDAHREKHFVPLAEKTNYRRQGDFFRPKELRR